MKKKGWSMRKHYLFFKEFINAPTSVGSLIPSSKFLAAEMCRNLTTNKKEPFVIELGPGTGVITEEIFRLIPKKECYVGFEISAEFRNLLREHFKGIKVIGGDATSMVENIKTFQNKADIIISSLPFTTMPQGKVAMVLESSWHYLRPGGEFRMFLYLHTLHLPKNKRLITEARKFFAEKSRQIVMRNVPPAMVINFIKI